MVMTYNPKREVRRFRQWTRTVFRCMIKVSKIRAEPGERQWFRGRTMWDISRCYRLFENDHVTLCTGVSGLGRTGSARLRERGTPREYRTRFIQKKRGFFSAPFVVQ